MRQRSLKHQSHTLVSIIIIILIYFLRSFRSTFCSHHHSYYAQFLACKYSRPLVGRYGSFARETSAVRFQTFRTRIVKKCSTGTDWSSLKVNFYCQSYDVIFAPKTVKIQNPKTYDCWEYKVLLSAKSQHKRYKLVKLD